MIKGLGIDLIDNKRIEKIINRWGNKFLTKIFTSFEIAYCEGKACSFEHYAVRFAAKEATVKMLGRAEGVAWHDIEVRNDEDGKPEIVLSNKAEEIAKCKGIIKIHISLSHEREMAIAEVIGEGE